MKAEEKTLSKTEKLQPRQMSGSHALLECLVQQGIKTIFGYPGGAIMPIYDALYDYKTVLNHILVRHEQCAVHAAQGFARSSGQVGVVFATSGPGATNLLTGLADAMVDSTPVVCITGQVFAQLLGTDAFQETDVVNITAPITKWNYQITEASEIAPILAKAFFIAQSGRPGPVLIDIAKNAQMEQFIFNGYEPCNHFRSYRPKPFIRKKYIERAAEIINDAKNPLIVFGQGITLGNAENELKAFVEKSGIPAASTTLGLSALSTQHPLYVGMVGMHGNYAPNVLTNKCDVLIAIGMRFSDRVTGRLDKYAKQAKIIHIDIDPAEIDKSVQTTVAVWGDCKETLPQLTQLVSKKEYASWLQEFRNLYQKECQVVINKELYPTTDTLTMGEVVRLLNEATKGDAILVSDVGQHQMFVCRYGQFNQTRSNITSGGLGTMGFGLPAGIGAKMGRKDRTVVVLAGDGGFQMNIQEFGTIMENNIDLKMIILNNHYLGMVRQWQQLFLDSRYSFVHIQSPDFVAVARAYKIEGQKVSQREHLASAITQMIAHPGAYLLEISIGNENNIFPMVPQGSSVSEIRLE